MWKIEIYKVLRGLLLFVFAGSLMSFTFVIDAGHGGDDFGAIGSVHGVKEKDLNLQVAKQLATMIRAKYPEVKVVLTRETDVFLPLQQRADIANKNHADTYISFPVIFDRSLSVFLISSILFSSRASSSKIFFLLFSKSNI